MFGKLFVRFRAVVFGLLVFSVLPILVGPAAPAAAQSGGRVIRVAVVGATSGTCGIAPDWSFPCDLQYALTTVAVSGDELWVAAATYKPTATTDRRATFQLRNGIALYGGFAGWESARDLRNPAANVTTLSGELGVAGNGDNSYHVVTGAGRTAPPCSTASGWSTAVRKAAPHLPIIKVAACTATAATRR